MSIRRWALAVTLAVTAGAVGAQETGQPASDVPLQFAEREVGLRAADADARVEFMDADGRPIDVILR